MRRITVTIRSLFLVGLLAGSALVVACASDARRSFEEVGEPVEAGRAEPDDKGAFSRDASGAADAEPVDAFACSAPVDLYIMFDRSGSMGEDCNVGATTPSRWCRSVNALSGYFKSAGAQNQAAALQFFPLDSHAEALCTSGSGYDLAASPTTPPAYTPLPTPAFDAVLNAAAPGSNTLGTPTEAALRGLTRFTAANLREGRVTIGVLVTDGSPNGCNGTLSDLSNVLAAHYAKTKVRTYVIGMEGASFAAIETIAQGGGAPLHPDAVGSISDACGNGAGPCRHWNVANGDPAVFTAALAAIQESADGCRDGGGYVNPPR
jgi:hypothetical protein